MILVIVLVLHKDNCIVSKYVLTEISEILLSFTIQNRDTRVVTIISGTGAVLYVTVVVERFEGN
jgi:hypothetical protein